MATAGTEGRQLQVTRLTGSVGAEITGVDFSRDIPGDIAHQIREAFSRYGVVVFRNERKPGEEEQYRLAGLFGEVETVPLFSVLGVSLREIVFKPGSKLAETDDETAPKATKAFRRDDLHNIGLYGEFDGWHSDSTFTPWFHRAAVLRANAMPPIGGDTGFASLCAAYDALSPMMQQWLKGVRTVHKMPDGLKEGISISDYGPGAEERFDAAFPPIERPLVLPHPETGRKVLFVNPSNCVHIVGLARHESHALLRFLCHHVTSASFVYRHHWQPNDLVLWDELTVLHRAPDDFAPHDREVVRVSAGRFDPLAMN